jgi:hypothetical protein
MTTTDYPEPSLTTAALLQGDDPRLMLRIEEVAELTGQTVRKLKRRAPVDGIPVTRIGNDWLVPRSWVEHITAWPRGTS